MSAPATTASSVPAGEVIPFSRLVRERSSGSHRDSEGAGFMHGLLKGEATRDDYIALVSQHWAIYEALEGAEDAVRDVPLVAPFLSPALTRLPALEADLTFLLGADWREHLQLVPATVEYAARIREVAATWPAGYIAHHYTRYLGDLAGGQAVAAVLRRTYGLAGGEGTTFYDFTEVGAPPAVRTRYRELLDAAPLDAAAQADLVAEARVAFACNTAMFADLAAATPT